MIYLISDTPDLLVETDNLEYVKRIVRAHPNCSIRELGSGKVYRPKLVSKKAPSGNPAKPVAEAKTA